MSDAKTSQLRDSDPIYGKELHRVELITILFEHCCIKVNYKYNMLEMSDKYEVETFEAVTDTWILGEHGYSSE